MLLQMSKREKRSKVWKEYLGSQFPGPKLIGVEGLWHTEKQRSVRRRKGRREKRREEKRKDRENRRVSVPLRHNISVNGGAESRSSKLC
jgi:hypothetical protein